MAQDTLKSAGITNLDAFPVTVNTSGVAAQGYDKVISDFVTPTAAGLVSTLSTYRMVRVPSAAILKKLELRASSKLDTGGAAAALLVDVGAYYSDAYSAGGVIDGTPIANSGNSISANCFLAARSFATTADAVASGVASMGDFVIDALRSMDPNLINQPVWKQAGLTADPGGFIDIVWAVHTAANTASSQDVALVAHYTS